MTHPTPDPPRPDDARVTPPPPEPAGPDRGREAGIDRRPRRPSPTDLITIALTAGGLLLAATVDMVFLVLAGLGAFGPGILRELGFLRDQDEFRRLAAWRAGYHAYLAGGLTAVILIAVFQGGTARIDQLMMPAVLILAVVWLAWLFSSVFTFWGPRPAVSRLLLAMGLFWLVFAVLANLDSLASLLGQVLVVLPFFLLSWLARRYPRVAGVLLVACAVAAVWFFGLDRLLRDHDGDLSGLLVLVVFVGPLLAGGLALLGLGREYVPAEPD